VLAPILSLYVDTLFALLRGSPKLLKILTASSPKLGTVDKSEGTKLIRVSDLNGSVGLKRSPARVNLVKLASLSYSIP